MVIFCKKNPRLLSMIIGLKYFRNPVTVTKMRMLIMHKSKYCIIVTNPVNLVLEQSDSNDVTENNVIKKSFEERFIHSLFILIKQNSIFTCHNNITIWLKNLSPKYRLYKLFNWRHWSRHKKNKNKLLNVNGENHIFGYQTFYYLSH